VVFVAVKFTDLCLEILSNMIIIYQDFYSPGKLEYQMCFKEYLCK
jgi:hypothetical protein